MEWRIAVDTLWTRISALEGKTLLTKRGSRFEMVTVDPNNEKAAVIVVPEKTGKPRSIARECFEQGESLGLGKAVRSVDIRNSGAPDWNPAYVAAILVEIALR